MHSHFPWLDPNNLSDLMVLPQRFFGGHFGNKELCDTWRIWHRASGPDTGQWIKTFRVSNENIWWGITLWIAQETNHSRSQKKYICPYDEFVDAATGALVASEAERRSSQRHPRPRPHFPVSSFSRNEFFDVNKKVCWRPLHTYPLY
jgi:hypothetical protein